jgi:hypothetical protein
VCHKLCAIAHFASEAQQVSFNTQSLLCEHHFPRQSCSFNGDCALGECCDSNGECKTGDCSEVEGLAGWIVAVIVISIIVLIVIPIAVFVYCYCYRAATSTRLAHGDVIATQPTTVPRPTPTISTSREKWSTNNNG